MIPVVVVSASIIPVALAVTIIAPLMPGMSIIPIAILIPEGDVSKLDRDGTVLTVVTAVSSVSV